MTELQKKYAENARKGRRLNWRQACALLGCGKNRFYRLIREGRLIAWRPETRKIGFWVYESDVLELIRPVNAQGGEAPDERE